MRKPRVTVTDKDVRVALLLLSDAVTLYQKEKDNDLAPDFVMRRIAYDEMVTANAAAKIVLEKTRRN